jgi:hypothetical protein
MDLLLLAAQDAEGGGVEINIAFIALAIAIVVGAVVIMRRTR